MKRRREVFGIVLILVALLPWVTATPSRGTELRQETRDYYKAPALSRVSLVQDFFRVTQLRGVPPGTSPQWTHFDYITGAAFADVDKDGYLDAGLSRSFYPDPFCVKKNLGGTQDPNTVWLSSLGQDAGVHGPGRRGWKRHRGD